MAHPRDRRPAGVRLTTRLAACACGRLTATVHGEPLRVSICHCLECQRRGGGVFAAQARFPASAVTVAGEAREFVRRGDSGGQIRNRFCPQCGSTVWYSLDAQPDIIAIPLGALADPTLPPPARSVYESRKHVWVSLAGPMDHEP